MRRILIPFHHGELAAARVLAATASKAGADEIVVLAADADAVPYGIFGPDVRFVTAGDVGISEERVAITAAAHGTVATARAIVAEAIRALAGSGDATIVLSPRTRVVAALDPLWKALEKHDSVLVPTLSDPSYAEVPERRMGLERYAPLSPTDVLSNPGLGSISTAVVGVRGTQGALIDGWPGRMGEISHFDALDDARFPAWLDGLGLTDGVHVLRDPGIGVAWFNLHEREPVAGPDGVLTDGAPLRLLDLLGFDARRPNVLCPGVSIGFLSEHPALIDEVRAHGIALIEAGLETESPEGVLAEHRRRQGRWATLPNGDQMVLPLRNLYRRMMADGELTGSPFGATGLGEMLAAFCSPGPRGKPSGLNRFVWSLWVERKELRDAYPRLEGADGPGLIGWAWAYARTRELVPESVLPPDAERFAAGDVGVSDPALAPESSRMAAHRGGGLDGVNVAGFFSTQLGLGESVRQLVHALRASSVEVTPVQGRVMPSGRGEAAFDYVAPDRAEHPVSILMLNGDSITAFAEDVGEDFFRDRYTIGFYWWEVDPYPAEAWDPALEYVDELWAGTEFVGDILRRGVDVPVNVVRVPVAEPPPVTVDRAHFGLPKDATLFGFVYDYESSGRRKNPLGLVEAYRKAFGPDDGAHLLLKSLGSVHRVEDHEEVLVAAADREDITIIDRFLTAEEKDSLVGLCDCYVSPHRSEGFGYTLAEAMAYGKPVVCTGYGGVLDFADASTARLVRSEPSITGPFAIPYPPDSRWVDPDVDHLAEQLRWVFDHPEEAQAMGERAREKIQRTHSYAASGASMKARLGDIYREIDERNRAASAAPPPRPAAAVKSAPRRAVSAALALPGAGNALGRARRKWWGVQDRAVTSRTQGEFDSAREEAERLDRELRELKSAVEEGRASSDMHAGRLDRIDFSLQTVAGDLRREAHGLAETRDIAIQIDAEQHAVATRVEALGRQLGNHEVAHAPVPYGVFESGLRLGESPYGRALHGRFDDDAGQRYGGFLERFRGDWDRISSLAAPYVTLLADDGPVFDLGCGRGELVAALTEAGIDARGVDLAPDLVAAARERGLEVEEGDALDALRAAPDESLGGVAAIHVVEHLGPETLEALLAEARRALRPGGVIMLETVNVYDVKAATSFWLDVTHRQPILPEALLSMTGAAGFAEAWLFSPDGSGDWEIDRSTSSRYTVAARTR